MSEKPTYHSSNGVFIFEDPDPITPNDEEMRICEAAIRLLGDFSADCFEIQRRSASYTTLRYRDSDVLRVKYTDRAKWVAVRSFGLNENDPRFAKQKNKKQSFWQADINSPEDVADFVPQMVYACKETDEWLQKSPV